MVELNNAEAIMNQKLSSDTRSNSTLHTHAYTHFTLLRWSESVSEKNKIKNRQRKTSRTTRVFIANSKSLPCDSVVLGGYVGVGPLAELKWWCGSAYVWFEYFL